MFKVGDIIVVPKPRDFLWDTHIAVVKKIKTDEDGNLFYLVECTKKDSHGWETKCDVWYKAKEAFDSIAACKEYILNYYYDGLCKGCNYESFDGNYTCNYCKHYNRYEVDHKDYYNCDSLCLSIPRRHEVCSKYEPADKYNYKNNYPSFEAYIDYLKNCEFNKECIHHKNSCHKTTTYEKYLEKYVIVNIKFDYNDRKVSCVKVKRKDWYEQNFYDKDKGIIKCNILCLEPIYTESGRTKKGTINNMIFFEDAVSINVKTGEIVS